MKLFFISDIHGSIYYLKKALKRFEEEKADYIVILGDILSKRLARILLPLQVGDEM